MPKVSAAHREAQEQRFLRAVRQCVAQRGVAAVSMEDIRVAAGASAGAVYRYYTSKDELVRAAIIDSLKHVEDIITVAAEQSHAVPARFVEAMLHQLEAFATADPAFDLFKVAIQGWAFAQQDPDTAAAITASAARQHRALRAVARSWTSGTRQEELALAMSTVITGYVTQRAMAGAIEPRQLIRGLGLLETNGW